MDKTANDEYDELLNIMETSFKMNNNPDILNIDSSKVKILDYNTENDTNGPDVIISKLDNTYTFTLSDPDFSIHSTLSVRFKCMHFRTLLFHIFIIPYDSFLDDSKHFNIILNYNLIKEIRYEKNKIKIFRRIIRKNNKKYRIVKR